MKRTPLSASVTVFFLLLACVGAFTVRASSENYLPANSQAAKHFRDGCGFAGSNWDRAVESFSRACSAIKKEGETSYYDGENRPVYAHLGLGNALLQLALPMSADSTRDVVSYGAVTKTELLKLAVHELQLSYKASPTEPARVRLIEALLAAHQEAEIPNLITDTKVKSTGEDNPLGRNVKAAELAAALSAALDQVGPGIDFHYFGADGKELQPESLSDVVTIKARATTRGVTVRDWTLEEIRAGALPKQFTGESTPTDFQCKWDTLSEDDPARDGAHQLALKVRFQINQGQEKTLLLTPRDVIVKNPNWVKVDLVADTSRDRARVVVHSSRPLTGSKCEVRIGTEETPAQIKLEPVREEFKPSLQLEKDSRSNQEYQWRYCYQGVTEPGINGTVALLEPSKQIGIKADAGFRGLFSEPLSLSPTNIIIDSAKAMVPANEKLAVEVSSTVLFEKLKNFELVAMNRKGGREYPVRSDDPDTVRIKKYSLPADPERYPDGITLLAKVDGQEKDSFYIDIQTPIQLQGDGDFPETVRVGEAIPLRFTFSRALRAAPKCELSLNNDVVRTRQCFPVGGSSYRTELFVAEPGDYSVTLSYDDPVLGHQSIPCNKKIRVISDEHPRFFLDVPLHLPQGTHPIKVSMEGNAAKAPDLVTLKADGMGLPATKHMDQGGVYYTAAYTVAPNATGDVHFTVDPSGDIEKAELTVAVDGRQPELNVLVPPITGEDADHPVRIRIYSSKALNGTPGVETIQGSVTNPCGTVKAVGPREWVAEAILSAIPGPSFVHVRGTDSFGNTGEVSKPLPIALDGGLRVNLETQQPWKDGDNSFTVYVNEGKLTDLTLHLQGEGTTGGVNAVRLESVGTEGREFKGRYPVRAGQRGFADLMLGSHLVRRVFVDGVGPKPDLSFQWVDETKLRMIVRDQRRLQSVIVTGPGGETRLTPAVNDEDRSEWYAEITGLPQAGALAFTARATDTFGRVGDTKGAAPAREKRDWQLTSDLASVRQGGKVTFTARSTIDAQQRLTLRITPPKGKDQKEVVPTSIEMEGRSKRESRQVWQLAEDVPTGTAEVEVLDTAGKTIARTQVLIQSADLRPEEIRPNPVPPMPNQMVNFTLLSPEPNKVYRQLPQAVFQLPKDVNPHDFQTRVILKDPTQKEFRETLTPSEVDTQTKAVIDEDAPDTPAARTKPDGERRFKLADLAGAPTNGQYALTVELLDAKGNSVGSQTSAFTFERPTVDKSKRWAVIVAVSKYKNPLTKELPQSYGDAAKLYRALASSYGHITVITDSPTPELPTAVVKAQLKTDLDKTLEDELTKAHQAKAEYLFFAFTGHGMSLNGESYLLPAQFNDDDPGTMLAVNGTLRKLTSKGLEGGEPTPHVLMLLDACQNAFGSKLRLEMIRPPAKARPDQTVHILASCQPGQVSLALNSSSGGNGQGSLFTDKFVALLKQGNYDDWLSFGDALTRQVRAASSNIVQMNQSLAAKLEKDYAQEPQIQSYPQSPDVFRNFREFFDRGKAMSSARLPLPFGTQREWVRSRPALSLLR